MRHTALFPGLDIRAYETERGLISVVIFVILCMTAIKWTSLCLEVHLLHRSGRKVPTVPGEHSESHKGRRKLLCVS